MPRFLVCLILSVFLTSCAPSFPEGTVTEGLVALCKREFDLDVQVVVSETTLGVLVPIPGLVAELMKSGGQPQELPPPILIEGVYQEIRFDFQFLARASLPGWEMFLKWTFPPEGMIPNR